MPMMPLRAICNVVLGCFGLQLMRNGCLDFVMGRRLMRKKWEMMRMMRF